jgi:hypothetical protein
MESVGDRSIVLLLLCSLVTEPPHTLRPLNNGINARRGRSWSSLLHQHPDVNNLFYMFCGFGAILPLFSSFSSKKLELSSPDFASLDGYGEV